MFIDFDAPQSGIAQGGGLTQTFHSSAEQYSNGFSLALRMISVAAGVTIGLFLSQVIGGYESQVISIRKLIIRVSIFQSIFSEPRKMPPISLFEKKNLAVPFFLVSIFAHHRIKRG